VSQHFLPQPETRTWSMQKVIAVILTAAGDVMMRVQVADGAVLKGGYR